MIKKKVVLGFFIGICFFSASSVFGSGWLGFDEGVKARGMGVAFTGLADDPTAVCYNPAGIVQLKGTQVSLGFVAATIDGSFESNGTSGLSGDSNGHVTGLNQVYILVPNFYITRQIDEKFFIGFGEYTEFGNPFGWPNTFPGRYAATGKLAQFETVALNPASVFIIKICDVNPGPESSSRLRCRNSGVPEGLRILNNTNKTLSNMATLVTLALL